MFSPLLFYQVTVNHGSDRELGLLIITDEWFAAGDFPNQGTSD